MSKIEHGEREESKENYYFRFTSFLSKQVRFSSSFSRSEGTDHNPSRTFTEITRKYEGIQKTNPSPKNRKEEDDVARDKGADITHK